MKTAERARRALSAYWKLKNSAQISFNHCPLAKTISSPAQNGHHKCHTYYAENA